MSGKAKKTQVTVLGGGFAGLETAFLLKHRLHDDVAITLVSDEPTFLFRPNTIYIPFGLDADQLRIPLDLPAGRQGIEVVSGKVEGIDTDSATVHLSGNARVPYEHLVIATGASMRPSEVPGLAEHANTIWTPEQMMQLGKDLERIVERARSGKVSRIVFLIPPNNKCSGPLYEIVFMVDTHLRRQKVRDSVELIWTTFEQRYIQAFGPKIHEVVVEEFDERKIQGLREWVVDRIEPEKVHYENGVTLDYDLLVAFPPYVSAVSYPLPSDDRGFLLTDLESRLVQGTDRIYAPGDAGDFPVKQAFLAFLQADAVAEDIVGKATDREPRARFDPVSMCVMEQFDKAVFAQVPLELTGDPASPVRVRPEADGEYKVGVSKTWRLGKKVLGVYLPMRFRAGEPFHAGVAWKMMESSLGMMSGVLAH